MGVEVAPILAACGWSRARLRDPFARVDAALDHTFWSAVEDATGDPAIGVRVGLEIAHRGRRSVDMYIALYSGTLRDLVANAERFAKLSDDRGHVQLIETGALATARIYRDGGYPRANGYVESLFAAGVCNLKQRVPGFRLSQVRLRRLRPADPSAYVDAFGIMPMFGAASPELSFSRDLLDVPLAGADIALAELLKEYASELVRKVPAIDPLLYAVQAALSEGLERGQVGLATIARATGTSARTLRRRLANMGTSFQEQLDSVRYDRAAQQLRVGQESVARIAERLGFASTTAFQRAFRRWTGMTPSAFRLGERAEGAPTGEAHEFFAQLRERKATRA